MVVMVVMTIVGSSEDHITHAQNRFSFRLLFFDTSKQVFFHVIEIGVLGNKPTGGCDAPTFCYYLRLACSNCHISSYKQVCVSLEDAVPFSTKSTVSLRKRCGECKFEGTLTLVSGHGFPYSEAYSNCSKPAPVMLVECSGVHPLSVDFATNAAWTVKTAAGNFVEVDLSTGEFNGVVDDGWISVSDVTGVIQDVAVKKKRSKKKRSKKARRVEYDTSDQSEGTDTA